MKWARIFRRVMTSLMIFAVLMVPTKGVSAYSCGEVMTTIDDVEVNANGADQGTTASCSSQGTYGPQYQCTELVDRYFGHNWTSTNGRDYFINAPGNELTPFTNGQSIVPPQHGDAIGFDNRTSQRPSAVGHIALVDKVWKNADGTYIVEIVEQNWNNNGRAQLSMTKDAQGHFTIENRGNYTTQGWLRYPKKFIDKRASTPHTGKIITEIIGSKEGGIHWWYPPTNPITNEIITSGDAKGMSQNIYVQEYAGKPCTINGTSQFCDGVIVYDALGGAHSAYLVWYQQFGGYSGKGGWYQAGGPHSTQLRNPITNSYWSPKDNCWRQDFQMGWLCYENIRSYDPGDVAPGVYDPWCKIFSDCQRWDPATSYAFAEAYERNGAAVNLGSVFDDGGSVFVHYWTVDSQTVLIQNFNGGNFGPSAIIYNPQDGNAYNVRFGFWEYYQNNKGPSLLGPPKEDEHGNSAAQPCAYLSCQRFEKGELWWKGTEVIAYVPSVYHTGGSDIPPPSSRPNAPGNLRLQ